MKRPVLLSLFATLLTPLVARAADVSFFAYYTALPSTEEFEQYSRTGDYADLVVKLGQAEGRLVFWRGASYLPYWETDRGKWFLDELVPRRGDGPARRPDRVNAFSHVALIETSPQRVVIAWRYLPDIEPGNPHPGVDPTRFAEELFEVYPDGKVTRTVRRGSGDVSAWTDPLNQIRQVLRLTPDGVREVSRRAAALSPLAGPITGNPPRPRSGMPPLREWRFDEAAGDKTAEGVSGARCLIEGPKALWRKGVSGTALAFDGYNSVVSLPAAQAPRVSGGSLTLEAWLALGAYPWNWAPLIQQGDNDGYFLGVDSHGYPGFKVKIDGVWEQLSVPNHPPYTDTNHLGVFTWRHLVGAYDREAGMMRLYLNGHEIAARSVGKGGVQTVWAPVRLGKAGIKRVPTEGTHDTLPSQFGIDGLIDEVRIYDTALDAQEVATAFAEGNPGAAILSSPDLEQRHFPVPATTGKFGAIYTHLPYYETWENLFRFGPYPDVVVGFDQLPTKFVFWRGVSFIPMIVNETNQWFTHEFNETGFTKEAPGDCEPMSDKPCYHSHVRVLENHDARVVVQWRYYIENPDHHWANYDAKTGWGDVADWYFYIYPDGVATVRMHLFTAKPDAWYEWNEQIAVLGEGQHPESVVRKQPVMTLVNGAGEATSYDWNPEPPNPRYGGNLIQMIHFTGQYSPFAIQDFDGGDTYSGERTWYSVFPSWNHWPTAQINSSGRNASFPDRASHSSISHLLWPVRAKAAGNAPFLEKILMEGMSQRNPVELLPLAKSWLWPPELEVVTDCRSGGYDPAQRAYVLAASGAAPSFRLAASTGHPIYNPAFVVRGWNEDSAAQVEIDGALQHDSPALRQGLTRDPNGRAMLVVWLQRQCTTPICVTLRGAEPSAGSLGKRPMRWARAPQLIPAEFAATMEATPVPGVGIEYFFECITDPRHNSGWIREPSYTDTELPSETEVSYRCKARDAYLVETGGSPVGRVVTPAAPAPVIWPLNEGKGSAIADADGHHQGVIVGTADWIAGVAGQVLRFDGKGHMDVNEISDLHSNSRFTWSAWIRTTHGGTILARAGAGREWQPGGKVLFIQNGRLRFDVGWVGAIGAQMPVADGAWHFVALTVAGSNVRCYVDGRLDGSGSLDVRAHTESGLPVRIGFCNQDFPPGQSAFIGDLDDVRWDPGALSPEQIHDLYRRGRATLQDRNR